MGRRLLAILLSGFASSIPVAAQEVSAGLTGRVTDPAGAPVLAASVTARDQDRGTSWNAATNEDGIYAFPRIPNGSYTLKIEAPGFKSYSHPNLALEINQRGRVDVVLQLGAVNESIEVTADTALLQTETTQLGAVVDARTLDDAPLL